MGIRRSLFAVLLILLLAIGSIYLIRSSTGGDQEQVAKNRFNTGAVRIQNVNKSGVVRVNSLEMGNSIKKILNSDPSVVIIKHNPQDSSHYYEHEVTVKFKHHPSNQEIALITSEINGSVVKNLDSTIVFRSNNRNIQELLQYFNGRENVVFAEPNYLMLQNEANLPNDTFYQEHYQWNLPVIQTEAGWDISRGDKNIKIAIVDTGVDLNHPDLKHRLIDGYNVLDENSAPNDDNGHGTHVAGIIASETNNSEGVAGLTWFNKIIPVKVMGAEGYGTTFDIAKGIIWAADHGADVINLSLGNYQSSAVMHEAVEYAYKKNVVLISAAGNDNSDQPSYPAAYPQVLSVSAVSYTGERAPFSNYGDYIDVAAPGVEIPSTYFNQQYAALSGTSMASPHVAGLAGLILSANPKLSNKEVMNIIKSSAMDLGDKGNDQYFGSGMIDVRNSLEKANARKTRKGQIFSELEKLLP